MRQLMSIGCVLALSCSAWSVAADDSAGRSLHEQHCTSCHGSEVYTREDRFVHDLDGLTSRVAYCARNASKVDWDQAQIDAVARYLDDSFYHF